jgi:hypothetical protein
VEKTLLWDCWLQIQTYGDASLKITFYVGTKELFALSSKV